jgi:molybdopterin converting factor small subunit
MTQVSFTENLRKHIECPPVSVTGSTVREVLEAVFAENPLLRSYILDDQSRVRRHVNVFINSRAVSDRRGLTDPVGPSDEVFVFQALSGG